MLLLIYRVHFTDFFHVNNINSSSNTCTQYTALILLLSVSQGATVDTEARFGAQRMQTFFVKTSSRRGNVSIFTFSSLLHCYCIKTKQDCCDRRKSDTVLQFDRTGSKILYAVDHVFHLQCAFNYLQPTKKFVFSAASRSHWFVTNYAEWLWGREWIFPGSLVSQVNWGMAGSKDIFVANWKLRDGIFS